RFRVKLIPKPSLEFKVNGRRVEDPIRGVDAMSARSITVKAIADKDFADFLPDDAHYQIFEWKLTIARGRTGVRTVTYNTETASLGSVANDLKPGDRFVIEVTQIKRRTFRGDWEIVSMPKADCINMIQVN
ncbi:MAG: gliding motility protein GldM, partial [Cytophagaceae bacterium]|nr:gliding motility protein GldM [Cytophagaceae bacterium]